MGLIAAVIGCIILAIFIGSKLLAPPPMQPSSTLAAVTAHLARGDVRRVTIPAGTITLEMNDGTHLTAAVPADRDLGPLIRRSGAEVTIATTGPANDEPPLLRSVSRFVPYVIMALLLVFILRRFRNWSR
jgi:hypothetical protein